MLMCPEWLTFLDDSSAQIQLGNSSQFHVQFSSIAPYML